MKTGTIPDEFKFMAGVNAAVVLKRYEEALVLFVEGLKKLFALRAPVDPEQFDYHISAPLVPLLRLAITEHSIDSDSAKEAAPSCSFCGKYETEVKQLIGGPSVFICDQCVGLCARIIADG